MNPSPLQATRDLLARIRKLRLLVVGDVMLDHYIWGDATRISPEAPVPVVDIARDSYTAGGAANVALNIVDLGARAEIAGWVGRDDSGARLLQIFEERAVRFDRGLFHAARRPTIVKTRVLVQRQQLCRLDREASPDLYRFDSEARLAKLVAKVARCDAVILSDYAKGLLDEPLVQAIATAARTAGKLVALDPKPKRRLAFHDLDLITPNRREAAELAGVDLVPHAPFPAEEICRRIHERHAPRRLVVTLGEDGMLLCESGRVLKQIPTAAREVFDVSGAGDTALAGLVLALAAGADLETAAHFSNAAAGVVVGKVGTATVTPDELLAYLAHTP